MLDKYSADIRRRLILLSIVSMSISLLSFLLYGFYNLYRCLLLVILFHYITNTVAYFFWFISFILQCTAACLWSFLFHYITITTNAVAYFLVLFHSFYNVRLPAFTIFLSFIGSRMRLPNLWQMYNYGVI